MTHRALARPLLAAIACAAAFGATAAPPEAGPMPPSAAASATSAAHARRHPVPHARPRIDRSGRQRVGKASVYAARFDGRTMADGTRMDPRDDNAASTTLPLGSTARVTDLRTGRSAVVTIRDRGPHVPGRIVDLSPATAGRLGIDRRQGIAKVTVTPITLPPPDAASGSPGASPVAKRDEPRATPSPVVR